MNKHISKGNTVNKILLIIFLAPLSLFGTINEEKLTQYIEDHIDLCSYKITHIEEYDAYERSWSMGYITALERLHYEIHCGKFE